MNSPQANIKTGSLVSNATEKLAKPFTETTKQTFLIILAVAAMFVLVVVVLYIAAKIKTNKLSGVYMQEKILKLDDRTVIPAKIDSSALNLPSVGQEFSYSFWLYLSERYTPTSEHKLLFQRGNIVDARGTFHFSTNPIVFLDKNSNKLYIAISTSLIKSEHTLDEIIQTSSDGKFVSGFMVGYIDYVPLQRWVNVTFFVKDDKLMIFMDGDLYSAVSINDATKMGETARPIIRETSGSASIGDGKTEGYISYSRFFNYALTQGEVRSIYERGPVKRSFLSIIGLEKYGLRTPIYNIEDDAKKT